MVSHSHTVICTCTTEGVT